MIYGLLGRDGDLVVFEPGVQLDAGEAEEARNLWPCARWRASTMACRSMASSERGRRAAWR
jgi:hypothetical protein